MGEPTLREEIAKIIQIVERERLHLRGAAYIGEWSYDAADQILALLDRRVPTLSPGNQEDSLSRDHAPSITGGPLDRAATREAALLAALEPFADAYGEGNDDFPSETQATVHVGRSTYYALSLGDFRHAAEVYASLCDGAERVQLGGSAASTGTPYPVDSEHLPTPHPPVKPA